MCGIAGSLVPGGAIEARLRAGSLVTALAHRGPDGSGLAEAGGVSVGMSRLRIRSAPEAVLPFSLLDGARAAYNGEVYLAKGSVPSGGTGEVEALVGEAARDADAMYAVGLLDATGTLHLSRDRFGIKPLFVREESSAISFASELQALLNVGAQLEIDSTALHEIIVLGRTLDRRTIYRGVRELDPGETLVLTPDGQVSHRETLPFRTPKFSDISVAAVRAAIGEAVARTLVSDRQIGLALSGGLDSSIIAYELKRLGITHINALSLAVPENYDGVMHLSELGFASNSVCSTWQHSVIPINQFNYFERLADVSVRMGEPFRMSSVPLYYALGDAAKAQGVPVLLLGEGADELFGGYSSYCRFNATSDIIEKAICDFYLGGVADVYITKLIGSCALKKLADRLADTVRLIAQEHEPKQTFLTIERLLSLEPLLRRSDHALMAAGVEGRTPFLHGVVPEMAAALPNECLWSHNETKIALRHAYSEVLPLSVVGSPKRALRAPSKVWREGGVAALNSLAKSGHALFAALGLHEDGVAAVRDGCSKGDPVAIPFAVALLSTGACLAHLAQKNRIADPELTRAAQNAAKAFPVLSRWQ